MLRDHNTRLFLKKWVRASLNRSMLIALPFGVCLTGAGCSKKPKEMAPTEQEIHSQDRGLAVGPMGRHPYVCDDGKLLLVDFKDNGLSIELRDAPMAPPIRLDAPAQGLQYQNAGNSAVFRASELILDGVKVGRRTCHREGFR